MEGWFETGEDAGIVCHSCTAQRGHQVWYGGAHSTRDLVKKPLPAFSYADTVTRPDRPPPKTP